MSSRQTHITQGERAVGRGEDFVISTILGSCVSCCLWDPVARVGGMNHMLLTMNSRSDGVCNLVGINAMELLINDILKLGASRDRLRAKAFGGARMVAGLSDIGKTNSQFTLDFLAKEDIACESHSFGGNTARHIKFWPSTGRALQKIRADAVFPAEVPVPETTSGNGMELF